LSCEYFWEREKALLGQRLEALFCSATETPARGLTVNRLRCTPEQFQNLCGLSLKSSPFCKEGFLLPEGSEKPGKHPYHHAGVFYSQEPSASAPASRLQATPGKKVLDLCAAPGGKSSQLAAALQGEGLLVSNEYVPARAKILESNLERMGVPNALILNENPQRIAEVFPGYFDCVLADVPCSGEGMFRKEEAASEQHSLALVEQCASLGSEILDAAAVATAPGGLLVYSTCTFSPEEDEQQTARFLMRHPEFELLEWGSSYGSPGEENRCGDMSLDVGKVCRIWPCHGGEGHYMACFQKKGHAESFCNAANRTDKSKDCPEWKDFAQRYFPMLTDRPVLLDRDRVYLPACPNPFGLRIVRNGVFVGTMKKGRFDPSHHLFMAYGQLCNNTERLTLRDPRVEQYLQGMTILPETASDGWCAVLVDGFPLGGGKVNGGILKNHYPKGLRIMGRLAF
jgi:16S rRNA C967 or C1407 C5-methylase (RsmB/RsmF family)/NOL1/NOP2/fmu family ribosome biogenesis protein